MRFFNLNENRISCQTETEQRRKLKRTRPPDLHTAREIYSQMFGRNASVQSDAFWLYFMSFYHSSSDWQEDPLDSVIGTRFERVSLRDWIGFTFHTLTVYDQIENSNEMMRPNSLMLTAQGD